VWRVAGLWSGPAGGLLLLTALGAGGAALSHRLGPSKRGAARTGSLAVLTLVGLLMVLVQARPYAQPPSPAAVGAGMPTALEDVAWHIETLATYLAVGCGAFVFAGVVAGSLVGLQSERRQERTAMISAAALLTLAVLAATWRAYGESGTLFESRGFSYTLAYVPACLLAYSSLHAPGGAVVPTWAMRWRRMLEFAFFPAVLGAWAAGLLGSGGPPQPRMWAGGLAVGIITGAVAGGGSRDRGTDGLRDVPGYGPWAFRGALLALALAGVGAVAGLAGGSFWADVAWAIALLGLGSAAAWSASRPAGGWRRVWVAAGLAAAAMVVAVVALVGREGLQFGLAGGLAVAIAVGVAADAVRVCRARQRCRVSAVGADGGIGTVLRRRTGRRRASALAHLGLAAIGLGIAAEVLTIAESRVLYPGDVVSLSGRLGTDVRVTYLGLSRYQANELDKRVGTFKLESGGAGPRLVTAEMLHDRNTDLTGWRPSVEHGALYDAVVNVVDVMPGESVLCRVAVRPLSWLVWVGGTLLILSAVARWSRAT
jgi:cytochrome c biogenesis factor